MIASLENSRKLVELGVEIKTEKVYLGWTEDGKSYPIPRPSTDELLAFLPTGVIIQKVNGGYNAILKEFVGSDVVSSSVTMDDTPSDALAMLAIHLEEKESR